MMIIITKIKSAIVQFLPRAPRKAVLRTYPKGYTYHSLGTLVWTFVQNVLKAVRATSTLYTLYLRIAAEVLQFCNFTLPHYIWHLERIKNIFWKDVRKKRKFPDSSKSTKQTSAQTNFWCSLFIR